MVEQRHTKSLLEAGSLARSRLETLRFETHLAPLQALPQTGHEARQGNHETYSVEWRLEPVPEHHLVHASVIVHWTDRFGTHSERLATLLPVPGMPGTHPTPARNIPPDP